MIFNLNISLGKRRRRENRFSFFYTRKIDDIVFGLGKQFFITLWKVEETSETLERSRGEKWEVYHFSLLL